MIASRTSVAKSHADALRVTLVRATTFSAAHRYFEPTLSVDENREIYGSLYKQKGFGHNFRLEAHFSGPIDSLTGMIVNLSEVDGWLASLKDLLDHKHLNEIDAFQSVSPTPERIATFCFEELCRRMTDAPSERGPTARLLKVRLYEGDALWVDCFE